MVKQYEIRDNPNLLTGLSVWFLSIALTFYVFRGDGTFGYGALCIGWALPASTIGIGKLLCGYWRGEK